MNAPDRERRTPDEQRASEAVRALSSPPVDAAYRERLKRQFASGALQAPARPSRATVPPWRRPALAWVALPAAAAAALFVVSALNRGPTWELVASHGSGEAVVDGVPVPLSRADELGRRLKHGVRVRLPENGEIEIALRGQIAMQVAPGTDLTLPAAAGRWFGRSAHANVAHGELRITTGAAFHGARLAVETPEAMVDVTGTTLAVICEPAGTCVCVLEGRVRVAGQAEGAGVMVREGRRRYVFNDARPPESAEIRPNEMVSLREFRDQRHAMMWR
jgi:ferric-dicitrate binding protein FerR (iron transport regulator)